MGDLSRHQAIRGIQIETKYRLPSDVKIFELHCIYREAKASMTLSICWVSRGKPTSISNFRRATSRGISRKSNWSIYA